MLIPESLLLERSDVLNQLIEVAERSRMLPGQVAVVSGESGVGKTSLISAMAARLGERVDVVWGHCDALFTPRHLGPFYDMAAQLGSGVQQALASGSEPANLFPAVLTALDDLADGTVLVFEDLHWADHGTLDLLKFITRRLAPLRLTLVLSYRAEEVGRNHPLTSLLGDLPTALTARFDLQPLSKEAVRSVAEAHNLDGAALYRVTGGNPFFLSEVLAQPQPAGSHLPGSVRDAVLGRVARAGEKERTLLSILCIAPDPVPRCVIEQLEGEVGPEACANCEARGLIVDDGDGNVRFRHELARMSLLDSLSPGERRVHQQRLLNAYLSVGNRVQPDRIVHHAAELGDAATLLAYAPEAAARAAKLGAHRQASSFLGAALRYVDAATPEQAARLYEGWAYHTSLFEISEEVLHARHEAVRLWRALNRPDRVGDNLRWIWRMHWYHGESEKADAAAQESLAILEAIAPSAELARAYALRAHINLLRGQRQESIKWGTKAIEMAAEFDDLETRLQALVSVATSRLFDGDAGGARLMEEALDLALSHGYHEEAARVYTNYSEYAIVTGDWPRAERLVLDGLAFDIKHGLDSWTVYLMGRHAQLRLAQGRLEEAETLARSALAEKDRTILMKLPALTVLAIARSRLGAEDAEQLLSEVLETALAIGEQQRLTPVRLAYIEHHYLREQWEPARMHLEAMLKFGTELLRPWDAGAVQIWANRLRVNVTDVASESLTEAQRLELAGDHAAAASTLDAQNLPFEAALCRLAGVRAGHTRLVSPAVKGFDRLGCAQGVEAGRRLADGQGMKLGRGTAGGRTERKKRSHPLGLTPKEVEVLSMMTEGASNAEIADRLSRSQRTVEHHVSSILGKLSASNRLEAILRVMAEPWIAQS